MENRAIDQFLVSGFLFPVFHFFSVWLKSPVSPDSFHPIRTRQSA